MGFNQNSCQLHNVQDVVTTVLRETSVIRILKGEVLEKLVDLQDVSGDTTGAALSAQILKVIDNLGLDPTKMRSQCYDGAGMYF